MTRPQEPLTAVLYDDGGLTRAGISRLAHYADQAIVVGGIRSAAIVGVLTEMGIPAVARETAGATLSDALDVAAESMPAVVATGTPLGAEMLVAELDRWQQAASAEGILVHVLSAGPDRSARVLGWTTEAASWLTGAAATFAIALGIRTRPLSEATQADVVMRLESAREDLLLVSARSASPKSVSPASAPAPVAASAVLHTILTDAGLTVTNRTPFAVDVRVRLGAVSDSQHDLGELEASLAPGAAAVFDDTQLPFFAGVVPPTAELRNWSHESETVFEGGERRINGVDVKYFDADGQVLAVASHGSHRGLIVGITASDISRALGAPLQSAGRRFEDAAATPAPSVSTFVRTLAGGLS